MALALGDGDAVAVGEVLLVPTPLLQTYFLPLLIHVNFLPFAVAMIPAFLQTSPALTAAMALTGARISATAMNEPNHFFM